MNSSTLSKATASVTILTEDRAASYDWGALTGELDSYGCAVLPKLLTQVECRAITALYPDESHFRSQAIMARHGFGRGEYRYFGYPLPDLIGGLRAALYQHLAGLAEWTQPAAGMFLWLKLLVVSDADEILDKLKDAGVVVVPGITAALKPEVCFA